MAKEFLKVRSGISLKPTAAPNDPSDGDIYYDVNDNQFKLYQGGIWTTPGAGGSGDLVWAKYTVSHTAFQTASTSNNITLFSLTSKKMIHQVVLDISRNKEMLHLIS